MPYVRYHAGGKSSSKLAGFLAGCVAGIIVGGALGMLIAPHRGDITRRKIVRKAGQTKDQVVEKVEDLMVHRREAAGDVDEEANS